MYSHGIKVFDAADDHHVVGAVSHHLQLKFFPALQAGGLAMLKAWSGPFFDVDFCPTGGLTSENAPQFLALPNVRCVGGSWLVPADALAAGDWARITALAAQAKGLRN
jgi:2-dehydro-3-deoxyphosphogluconate aldolase/(4S)-4-hydroxy-2-oxoglutarate aldolase